MVNQFERLKNLENNKLIDVVKNYRQYGYTEELRLAALKLLHQRGITKEELEYRGQFENKTYSKAKKLYDLFSRNSKIAFVFYGALLLFAIFDPFFKSNSGTITILYLITNILVFVFYTTFLILSFVNQHKFYKMINLDNIFEGVVVYLFLGAPFYIFMYFYFRNQMGEKMNEIK
ncbi:MAG: hypothetical protein JXQ93_07565 [Flavobacteriaceae bacterium]